MKPDMGESSMHEALACLTRARECLHDEARRLCSQVADSFDLSHRPNFVGCVDETFAKALRQVAPPALVAGAAAASAQPASHP